MNMKNTTVTQNDVAKAAGVTRSMVSYVINGNTDRSVSPETRQKILDAIDELGYRPNKAAQALMQGGIKFASNRIGVILCNENVFLRPYYADIISGIHTEAYEHNYHISFIRFFDDLKDPVLFNNLIHNEEVGGLILIGLDQCVKTGEDIQLVEKVKERIANIVCVEWQYEGISSIGFDRQRTCQSATEYLFTKGYKSISYIGEMDDRVNGYKSAFMMQNLKWDDFQIQPAFDIEGGFCAVQKILENSNAPEAIVCGSDEVAIGVLRGLDEHGLRVPENVGVISMDNIEISGFTNPPLTTMNVQKKAMGTKAVELIVANAVKENIEVVNIMLPTSIVERKSC